jgi:hypothetical protein
VMQMRRYCGLALTTPRSIYVGGASFGNGEETRAGGWPGLGAWEVVGAVIVRKETAALRG